MNDYRAFLESKRHYGDKSGFSPSFVPDWLFDFQKYLVTWAVESGRCAVFADCGLGKTPMQLVWAQNVVERTNRHVLVLAPLATSAQTVREANKFGIEASRSRDGRLPSSATIVVTNYEQLDKFNYADFSAVVCDESSILKNFDGKTKAQITDFMRKMPYRLLCTATAAPNDYIELGTSSEAIGNLGYIDMLGRFFRNDEGSSISPMSYQTKWTLKPHAVDAFWRWVCSWARAIRKPSDIGFDDGLMLLPPLETRVTSVPAGRRTDTLFEVPAGNLNEQREERRLTIRSRCEAVAALAPGDEPFVAWCHLNDEGDLLTSLIPGAVQVSGADKDERKEEVFEAFTSGQVRVLVTKPKIGGFGLNWQHCNRMSLFPSHSFEQYYQSIRRCWRFGQTRPVVVDIVTSDGEADVLGNLRRKSEAADAMFERVVMHMRDAMGVSSNAVEARDIEVPNWLMGVK